MPDNLKSLQWVGSSKKDLLTMPEDVIDVFGFALHLAQMGKKHDQAKPLKGFGGASVLEVVEDHMGDTYLRFTPSRSQTRFMCCTASRRNPPKGSKRQSLRWI